MTVHKSHIYNQTNENIIFFIEEAKKSTTLQLINWEIREENEYVYKMV
jgi:hypothetical protein